MKQQTLANIASQLLCPYLGWQAHSVEAPAHLGDLLQGVLLPPGFGSVNGVVVERLAGQIHHLAGRETVRRGPASSILNGMQPIWSTPLFWAPLPGRAWCRPVRRQLRRGNPGWAAGSLDQSSTDSTAEEDKQQEVPKQVMKKKHVFFIAGSGLNRKLGHACYLVKIFGPFGVQVTVRFLSLWFENANDFLKKEKKKKRLFCKSNSLKCYSDPDKRRAI